ncbi:fasciclin domain-containing protein [Colwellia sp. MEBiC06753]
MNLPKLLSTVIIALGVTFAASSQALAKQTANNSLLQVTLNANAEGIYAGYFDTLIAGVLAADPAVIEVLASKGQHTVFAPTDDAFGRLGLDENNIGDLDTDTLTTILIYHVVHGRLYAEDVLASDKLNTLIRGKTGFVMQEGGMLTDNAGNMSPIIVTDIEASNGIIHVIDGVLMPE